MKGLPIYRFAPQLHPSLSYLDELSTKLFGMKSYSLDRRPGRSVLRSESHLIEVDDESGKIWSADLSQLWNVGVISHLSDKENASRLAQEFLSKNALLPATEDESRYTVEFVDVVGSFVSMRDEKDKREDRQLDHRARYAVKILVEDSNSGSSLKLPIMSGEGKFAVTIGDSNKIIGYHTTWQPLDLGEIRSNFIPREVADRQFKTLTSRMAIESFDADLAYACGKSNDGQRYLYPVWIYKAFGKVKGHKFPMRIVTLPASEFGPHAPNQEPLPKRFRRSIARPQKTSRSSMLSIGRYEAATSWIGEIGGLSGSRNNARGFIDGLRQVGWNINFDWGDCNAWESDWHENDDEYVDSSDFIFYAGHADEEGWMLVNPSDCAADYLEPQKVGASSGTPGDIWGRQDLEWIVIAGCGPLEDDLLSSPGGGDALDRWDGAFDGLHTLMGYGAVTFDNEEEGRRLIAHAREGYTLINAWFRTAQETQPFENEYSAPYGPKIYVGAMWATKDREPSPLNDHLWGFGSVAPDPRSPDTFTCMWVPC